MINYSKIFTVLSICHGFIIALSAGEEYLCFQKSVDSFPTLGPARIKSTHDWSDPQCSGNEQSPINIDPLSVKIKSFEPIYVSPTRLSSAIFLNNGHSIQIIPEMSSRAIITGGPMKDQIYKLEQIHFHWGENDRIGSEHVINKRSFPLEMHIVFYNLKYSNYSNAMELADGLVVMGVLFKVSKRDNPNFDFTQKFYKLSEFNASIEYEFYGQRYSSLLPTRRNSFYTYHGSLTTSPCSESVTWIVFMDQVPISSRQLSDFRSFQTEYGEIITQNYRQVQPLNKRVVFSSCDAKRLAEEKFGSVTSIRENSIW